MPEPKAAPSSRNGTEIANTHGKQAVNESASATEPCFLVLYPAQPGIWSEQSAGVLVQ